MRVLRLLAVSCLGLGLFAFGGCAGRKPQGDQADELKPRDVIVGKWQAKGPPHQRDPHIQGYEFSADDTVRVFCMGSKEPITGKYKFDDDATLALEYDVTPQAKKTYADAVQKYKNPEGGPASKKDLGPAELGNLSKMEDIFGRIPDELPAAEKLTIMVRAVDAKTASAPAVFAGLSKANVENRPVEMVLVNGRQFSLAYRKVK